jgi:hypothetical protein
VFPLDESVRVLNELVGFDMHVLQHGGNPPLKL